MTVQRVPSNASEENSDGTNSFFETKANSVALTIHIEIFTKHTTPFHNKHKPIHHRIMSTMHIIISHAI